MRLMVLLVALAMAGCASKHFDEKAAPGIHSIAIAKPVEPSIYGVGFYANNAGAQGAIGLLLQQAIVDANTDQSVNQAFTEALVKKERLELAGDIAREIETSLKKDGYACSIVDMAPLEVGKPRKMADNRPVDADAVMDIRMVGAGYVDQFFVPYQPMVLVEVLLTDKSGAKTLFRQEYNYSSHTNALDDVHLDFDSKYQFHKVDELLADTHRAAEGFRAAAPKIGVQVGLALKKP